MKAKTATLTAAEDRAWVDEFNQAKEEGKTDLQADAQAARAVRRMFPRLRKYAKFAP